MASTPVFVPHKHAMEPMAAMLLQRACRAEERVAYWTRQIRTCRSLSDRQFVNAHIRAAKRERDESFARAEALDRGAANYGGSC